MSQFEWWTLRFRIYEVLSSNFSQEKNYPDSFSLFLSLQTIDGIACQLPSFYVFSNSVLTNHWLLYATQSKLEFVP